MSTEIKLMSRPGLSVDVARALPSEILFALFALVRPHSSFSSISKTMNLWSPLNFVLNCFSQNVGDTFAGTIALVTLRQNWFSKR